MSISDQLIQVGLKSLAIICPMSSFFVEGTLPPLVMPFGIASHGFRFLEVGHILNKYKEVADSFFENHVDPFPHLTLVVN